VGEDLELVRDADVVAVGGQPEGNPALADLAVLEGLDHALLQGLPPDPAVTLDHRYTLSGSYCLRRRRVKSGEAVPTSHRSRRPAGGAPDPRHRLHEVPAPWPARPPPRHAAAPRRAWRAPRRSGHSRARRPRAPRRPPR